MIITLLLWFIFVTRDVLKNSRALWITRTSVTIMIADEMIVSLIRRWINIPRESLFAPNCVELPMICVRRFFGLSFKSSGAPQTSHGKLFVIAQPHLSSGFGTWLASRRDGISASKQKRGAGAHCMPWQTSIILTFKNVHNQRQVETKCNRETSRSSCAFPTQKFLRSAWQESSKEPL